jgi:Tfp pilus assembly protein FimT
VTGSSSCSFDLLKITVETAIPNDLAAALNIAKSQAASRNDPVRITCDNVELQVRKTGGASAFSVSTSDYRAKWYLLDPHNKPKANSGVMSRCRFRGHEDKIVTKELASGYDERRVQPCVQD